MSIIIGDNNIEASTTNFDADYVQGVRFQVPSNCKALSVSTVDWTGGDSIIVASTLGLATPQSRSG